MIKEISRHKHNKPVEQRAVVVIDGEVMRYREAATKYPHELLAILQSRSGVSRSREVEMIINAFGGIPKVRALVKDHPEWNDLDLGIFCQI